MAEIDSIGNNFYFAGVQNTTSNSINKNQKKQEIDKTKKSKFASLLSKQEEVEPSFSVAGLPPEIAAMSLEDAAVYLKDAVDLAGNDLSSEVSQENIKKFKEAVGQFILFVVRNNYEISSKRRKNRFGHDLMVPSRTNFFSNYTIPPHVIDPKYQITVINKKLDEITQATLENQIDNLKILAQINEIKGLIVDLISS